MTDNTRPRRRSKLLNDNGTKDMPEAVRKDWGVKITVHRGTEQIGGCVTEYEHGGWRLFVDYGEQLPGAPVTTPLQIEGLTHGDVSRSAQLITLYHGDHIGSITELPEELPVYMSAVGRDIQQFASEHLSSKVKKQQQMAERLKQVRTFTPGTPFTFGPFTIIPIVVDHSAFDASAFKITADYVSVFHTGDFRTHGFRSKTLPEVIEKFIGHVDYVVCEGTNIARHDATSLTEPELQRQFEAAFRAHKNNIVYLSSTNIDRLFALYHAAQRAGRPFIVSSYQKRVMDLVIGRDPVWGKSRMYQYSEHYEPLALQYTADGEFRISDKFQYLLEQKGCVLIAQANERFDHLVERLSGERQTYLSMWKGYVREGSEAFRARLVHALGKDYLYMHTSGHSDMPGIRSLLAKLKPLAIIPIHTDEPEAFAQLFSDEWPVIRLHDGETLSPISSRVADACSASVITSEKGVRAERLVGNFRIKEDARFALAHATYCPTHLLGYKVMEEEDLSPSSVQTYDASNNYES